MYYMKNLQAVINSLSKTIPSKNVTDNENIIEYIDPGHGAMNESMYYVTHGKMSHINNWGYFYEGVWTRYIAWMYAFYLFLNDKNYVLSVSHPYKDVALVDRISRLNSIQLLYPDKNIYLHSIHSNAFYEDSVRGVEIYTSPGQTGADAIATDMINQYRKYFPDWRIRADYSDNDPDKEELFYVLKHSEKIGIDAILSETGFYTNKDDIMIIMDIEKQKDIIKVFYNTHLLTNDKHLL